MLPRNWRALFADVARFYGWPPGVVEDLSLVDLFWWHAAALDVVKAARDG